ncbi:polysaccharide pyruvyl transferase family protein [Streptococcus sp. ZJ151]|uniref:polysaccharide pyruvyl transferase family protein n=1 Tax=Streptococcus jiangjianxini TaxID=3161189 RepID=UPI0032ECA7E3
MKKTIIFDPALSSMNMGDHIISEAVREQIDPIIKDSFIIDISTHLPISRLYTRHIKDSNFKFVAGSNLLRGKMDRIFRQWDIRLDQKDLVSDSILVGAGWWQYGDEPNFYTKILYNNILSKDYLHSVRDEFTKEKLNSIGINNVLNTSCATMWKLTKEHNSKTPQNKAKNVIFTVTDYKQDKLSDEKMINCLIDNYENVYFWIQGFKDEDYYQTLNIDRNKINIIGPSLAKYNEVLINGDVDFVGTRLHAGIRALQNNVRTLIIGVDNRAIEKQKNFNINVLERKNIDNLEDIINSKMSNEILIPEKEIKLWKDQFQ